MNYMLDTNILIYLMKNKPLSVAQHINGLDDEARLCMSFITFAGLLKSAERSIRKAEVIRQLDQLTRQIRVEYAASKPLCAHYASQFVHLKDAGTPIGANDLWIARDALALDCTLVTNNTREFARVSGLRLENWVQ